MYDFSEVSILDAKSVKGSVKYSCEAKTRTRTSSKDRKLYELPFFINLAFGSDRGHLHLRTKEVVRVNHMRTRRLEGGERRPWSPWVRGGRTAERVVRLAAASSQMLSSVVHHLVLLSQPQPPVLTRARIAILLSRDS